MTLQNITVKADYCFGESPLRLENLSKINFIFAPNGSGKTTISGALAEQPTDSHMRSEWVVAPTDLPIRVFNEKYRSQVLTERVNGIFTMGRESEVANNRIDQLTSQIRSRVDDRSTWSAEIGFAGSGGDGTGLLGDIEKERGIAAKAVFEHHKTFAKPVIETVFVGVRSKIASFISETLRRADENKAPPEGATFVNLESRIASLTGNQEKLSQLSSISVTSVITEDQIQTLGQSVASGGEGELAQLIEELSNKNWVHKGREYISAADGKCPFCQQGLPHEFMVQLAEYFAGGFDDSLRIAREIRAEVRAEIQLLEDELDRLANSHVTYGDESDAITASVMQIRTSLDLLSAQLNEKCEHPTSAVQVHDVSDLVEPLVRQVDRRNVEIAAHNQVVADAKNEKVAVVEDGWALFLQTPTVASAVKRFRGIEKKKNDLVEERRGFIAQSEQQDSTDAEEISTLRSSISNTAEVAERINGLLRAMNFNRFGVAVDDEVVGGYRIVRADNTYAFDSLSEGEKSFLCFAYFWESLFGSVESGGQAEDVVAVFDDPISSLDSDTLFIVAAYIRHAASKVLDGSSNLRQLIVFTHNTQFHNEAAYTSNHGRAEQRHHYRLVKGIDGYTQVVDDGHKSKIRGTYPLLWDSVVEAARNEDESALVKVGVFNIVRRIIEGYFKHIGSVPNLDKVDGLNVTDERAVGMFHMWASAGSHTIADDFDQTVDVGNVRNFLKLFRRFFDLVNHSAHFDMMLAASHGEDLAEPAQVFEQIALAQGVFK